VKYDVPQILLNKTPQNLTLSDKNGSIRTAIFT